jgi:hypothetical protein
LLEPDSSGLPKGLPALLALVSCGVIFKLARFSVLINGHFREKPAEAGSDDLHYREPQP